MRLVITDFGNDMIVLIALKGKVLEMFSNKHVKRWRKQTKFQPALGVSYKGYYHFLNDDTRSDREPDMENAKYWFLLTDETW